MPDNEVPGYEGFSRRWLEKIKEVAREFGNRGVFRDIRDEYNSEFGQGRPIIYKRIDDYFASRFKNKVKRLISERGYQRPPRYLSPRVSIPKEVKSLAVMIAIRETRLFGRGPISSFSDSGLDFLGRENLLRSVRRRLIRGSIIRDDPSSDDPRDVLIERDAVRSVFTAYMDHLRDKYVREFYDHYEICKMLSRDEEILYDIGLADKRFEPEKRRPFIFFWLALAFGGVGGRPWQRSRDNRIHGLKTLKTFKDLLSLNYWNVPKLWDERFLLDYSKGLLFRFLSQRWLSCSHGQHDNDALNKLSSILRLDDQKNRRFYRMVNELSRQIDPTPDHLAARREVDIFINDISRDISRELQETLKAIRIIQAIKIASITEGLLRTLESRNDDITQKVKILIGYRS